MIADATDADEHDRCPACGAIVGRRRAGTPEEHCPSCGRRLWFVRESSGNALVVRLGGAKLWPADLDEAFAQIAQEARAVDLAVDFREVRTIDSSDLAKLITLKKRLEGAAGNLEIRNLRPELKEVFRITRLDRVFKID